jgi:GTP-binding protein
MNIKKAIYVISSPEYEKCPAPNKPEYAFIGRSNVGKSSLINMLVQRKELARTSGTPGKTISMNFFCVNEQWNLVDLPGYGYARRSKDLRSSWEKTLWNYLEKRDYLVVLFVLIDSRIEPQEKDLDFINQLGEKGIPFKLVFTKLDKLKVTKAEENIEVFKAKLLESWEELPDIFLTSALDKRGRMELLKEIQKMNKDFLKILKQKDAQLR